MTGLRTRPHEPSKEACGWCGEDPASGFATIDDVRYCHGDFDPEPTCYMQAQVPPEVRNLRERTRIPW